MCAALLKEFEKRSTDPEQLERFEQLHRTLASGSGGLGASQGNPRGNRPAYRVIKVTVGGKLMFKVFRLYRSGNVVDLYREFYPSFNAKILQLHPFHYLIAHVAGVDEVGIGPLLVPWSPAVILNPADYIEGLDDSKSMSERRRQLVAAQINARALCVSVGLASVEEIDRLNVLNASHVAMQRAVAGLSIKPDHVLVDGNKLPNFGISAEAIVQGDKTEPVISAASIVAKVTRDAELVALGQVS